MSNNARDGRAQLARRHPKLAVVATLAVIPPAIALDLTLEMGRAARDYLETLPAELKAIATEARDVWSMERPNQ